MSSLYASQVHAGVRPERVIAYRRRERELEDAYRRARTPAEQAAAARALDAHRTSPIGAAVRRGTW